MYVHTIQKREKKNLLHLLLLNLESGTEGGCIQASLFRRPFRVINQFLIHIIEMVWDHNQTFQNQFCIFGTIV